MKSVTILTPLPSGFTTKKAGEHHSVGSWHGVITFFFGNSFMQASAGSLNLKGICLAADTRYGNVLGLRNWCTFSDSIGCESGGSLKTLGYLSRISRHVDDSTEETVLFGNCLSMMLSFIRSCHERRSTPVLPNLRLQFFRIFS